MDYIEKRKKQFRLKMVLEFLKDKLKAMGMTRAKVPSCMALLFCPIITFYLFDAYTHNPFTAMNFKTQLLNILFYHLMVIFLFGIFRYVRLALMIQSGLFMLIGLVNYYVLNFRSAPIMPWDIYSLQTAASVADNFSYQLDKEAASVLVAFVVLLLLESRFSMRTPGKWKMRLAIIVLPVMLLFGYTNLIQNDSFISEFGLYDKLFTPTVMNKRDGNVVAFLMELEYLNVEKPEGYSAEEMAKWYQQGTENSSEWITASKHPKSLNRPNIIVIMDEAFSDLSVIGELKTNQDDMPFVHKLQQGAQNTITGYANVSVLGGNTANSEFEFLTGNTMGFLPQGSVAYQQYLKAKLPNLASYLKSLGYTTTAMHPYYADGWERDRVYPLMGFDEFLSMEDFKGKKKVRNYISDGACFDKIIELYEQKDSGEPMFVFNVTMQNHSGYEEEFSNFTPDITVEGISAKALPAYLSLIKKTDAALEKLITYFEKADEDTIIVFFGDHQPTSYVSNPILRNNGVNPDGLTTEENMLKYKVPYVIWSNFDIEEKQNQETSLNYLSIDLLHQCKLPLPFYLSSLEEIREEYPIVSAMGVVDSNGRLLEMEDCGEALNQYRRMQYYLLFDYDRNHREKVF